MIRRTHSVWLLLERRPSADRPVPLLLPSRPPPPYLSITSLCILQVIDDKERIHLGPEHIKAYMKMILEGMDFLHRNWVLHRYEITGISLMRASFLCKTSVCRDKLRPERSGSSTARAVFAGT
jgi:hypothetical protein